PEPHPGDGRPPELCPGDGRPPQPYAGDRYPPEPYAGDRYPPQPHPGYGHPPEPYLAELAAADWSCAVGKEHRMTTPAPHTGPQLTAPAVPQLRAGIVAARWHEEITTGLLGGAQRALHDAGIAEPTVLRVPGSFE